MLRSFIRMWHSMYSSCEDIADDQLKKARIELLYAELDLEADEVRVQRLRTTIARLTLIVENYPSPLEAK